MLREKDPRIQQAIDALWGATAHLRRGDTIAYDAIEEAAGCDRRASRCRTVIRKFRARFQVERGVWLVAVENVGLRLATVEEQVVQCSEKRTRRAARQIHWGINHMAAVPEHELPNRLRAIRNGRVDSQRKALRQVRAARRRDAALLRPPGDGNKR